MSKVSEYDKLLSEYQNERDKRSMELFDKPEDLLEISERLTLHQYMNDLNNPKWKIIVVDNKDTNYEVSNTGIVRNAISKSVLIGSIGSNGYRHVSIQIIENGWSISRTLSIHRLVATAFIPNPDNKPEVNHINGKKLINWVGNLEWNTISENTIHAIKMGLLIPRKGSESPVSLYTDEQIRYVCSLLQEGIRSKEDISKITGVSRPVVTSVALRKRWNHISKDYKFNVKLKPKRSIDDVNNVRLLISEGLSNSEIISKLGWNNNSANLSFISFNRKKMMITPTTIDQL